MTEKREVLSHLKIVLLRLDRGRSICVRVGEVSDARALEENREREKFGNAGAHIADTSSGKVRK